MPENNEPKKQYETGHAKLLESFDELIALSGTLDQTRLDPPLNLTITALQTRRAGSQVLQNNVGDSRADWRTSALARAVDVEKFAPLASQAVGALAGRGASAQTVKDAQTYVRKLQGGRAEPKPADDPNTPDLNESEKGISASQQSSAAQIATMYELIDFLEAQPEYADVGNAGLTVVDMRGFVDSVQAKHQTSITDAAALSNARIERNKDFYLDADNICDLAKQFKNLVKGAYGANSPEYKAVNAISFIKIKP